jgi:acyl-CoA thioester hydrolase
MKQHETQIRVRYEDADPMGFLHHSKYFTYFEIGRMELFRAAGGNYRELEEAGVFAVVVSAECKFKKPARFDDVLTVQTTLAKITMVKIQYEYRLLRDQELLARGRVTVALVNGEGAVQAVPDWMREMH